MLVRVTIGPFVFQTKKLGKIRAEGDRELVSLAGVAKIEPACHLEAIQPAPRGARRMLHSEFGLSCLLQVSKSGSE